MISRVYIYRTTILLHREIINIFQADKIGTHIITVPHEILKKMSGIGKDLNQLSLETVKMFLSDATNAGFKIDTK